MFNANLKGLHMSDNQKFISGLAIITCMAALGFVLVASYFDVLVK